VPRTGYFGRTGVFEIFSASNEVRHLNQQQRRKSELVAAGRNVGLRTLREAAVRKLATGQRRSKKCCA